MDELDDLPGHVFISYVRENLRAVNRLQRIFESAGIRVWRDTANLWPGEDWREQIRSAITSNALVFIACFSRESIAREASYQNEELALAVEQLRLRRPGVPWLIPVRFNDCDIPERSIGEGKTLSSIQRADLFGRRSRENTERLVVTVLRILGQGSSEPRSIITTTRPMADRRLDSKRPPQAEQLTSYGETLGSAMLKTGPPTEYEPGQETAEKADSVRGEFESEAEPSPASKEQKAYNGSIITFYSYKGGTGRTMALANVAWILASNGYRVLAADWDLESPGLNRFFEPFLDPEVAARPGIIDLIRRYEWAAVELEIDAEALDFEAAHARVTRLIDEHIGRLKDYAVSLNWQFPGRGCLHFLSPGRQVNRDYEVTISTLDWDSFYDRLHGGLFFDALRAYMKSNYDYALIDSRTGLSDLTDICTVHMPDVVVTCFTLSAQGIEGAAMVADLIQDHTERRIRVLPVPTRIDHAQIELVDTRLAFATRKFGGLPGGMSEEQRREYWSAVEVPYRGFYAYEEMLAVFGDPPGSPASLLSSFERLTAQITDHLVTALPQMDEKLRRRTKLLFTGSDDHR